MNLKINKTDRLEGSMPAPPSKSYTHRAIMIAGLNGETDVVNPSNCEDALNTIEVWRALGAGIERDGNRLRVRGFQGKPSAAVGEVNVGEAGTLLRFLLPIVAMSDGTVLVTGESSLLSRPNREVVEILQDWGIDIEGQGEEHCLPIRVRGAGGLPGGETLVDASRSSQTVSALLIAAPFAGTDTDIIIKDRLASRPYVDITTDVLKWAGVDVERGRDASGRERFHVKSGFGFKPGSEYTVHGDWSGAAFLLAAGAVCDSEITVTDLVEDMQGDRRITAILESMGANITRRGAAVTVRGPCSLKGVEIDCGECPDLAPVLTVLGCFAKGRTRLYNAGHLAIKESNRLSEPGGQLNSLGANVSFAEGEIIIEHRELEPGTVSSCGDHRIAMAMAVAALGRGGDITINNMEVVAKSYPGFVKDIESLGARVEEV